MTDINETVTDFLEPTPEKGSGRRGALFSGFVLATALVLSGCGDSTPPAETPRATSPGETHHITPKRRGYPAAPSSPEDKWRQRGGSAWQQQKRNRREHEGAERWRNGGRERTPFREAPRPRGPRPHK